PLLLFSPILNSRWSLKSLNFFSLTISTQGTLFVIRPSDTLQHGVPFSLRIFQPVKSRPLNNATVSPQRGAAADFSAGARSAVHLIVLPLGLSVVPSSLFPTRRPLKTRSFFCRSYWMGRLNVSSPPAHWICGTGRALPVRPTNRPVNLS